MNGSEVDECAICRRELRAGAPRVKLSVGLNPEGGSELVEETHELVFCTVPSEHWPTGCSGKASELLDFFVARLWDLRAPDVELVAVRDAATGEALRVLPGSPPTVVDDRLNLRNAEFTATLIGTVR